MPRFVAKIEARMYEVYSENINVVSSFVGKTQVLKSDFVDVYGYTSFLQRLTNADNIVKIDKPSDYGLKNNYNSNITNVEISKS